MIFWTIISAPGLAFILLKPFTKPSFIKRILISVGLLVILMLSQLNKNHEVVYAGTNIHIPILWTLAYIFCWVWILSISIRIIKIAIISAAAFMHVALSLAAIIPGIWIIADLSNSSEVIFIDKRIKAYQTGWGNFSHSGIDLHVVRRGCVFQKVLFYQRIRGSNPKDKVISIQSDDEFIYRILQSNSELKTLIVP